VKQGHGLLTFEFLHSISIQRQSSFPTDMMVSPTESGIKVDVTVLDITGIMAESDIRDATATVSFTGTVSSMQVSSLNMCSRTGNLVIESKMLETVEPEEHTTSRTDASPIERDGTIEVISRRNLYAEFNDPMVGVGGGRRSMTSCGHSTSSKSSSQRPHLQLILSSPQPVPQNKVLVTSRGGDDKVHSTMENVELHITLKNRDYSICTEGTACVTFDEDKQQMGTKTMDLAIRCCQDKDTREDDDPSPLTFSEDASIRININVTPADHPSPSPAEITFAEHCDQEEIDDFVSKLNHDPEITAEARSKVNKLKFPQQQQDENKGPRRMFCNAGLDFGETLRGVVDALTRCDKRTTKGWGKNHGIIPILRTNSTMDSTIETRDSLMI